MTSTKCPECGSPLAAGATAGLCPRCLLASALIYNTAPPPRHRPASGDWIGPYRLVRPLGEGGMGVVYLAEQEEPIARQVALKVIKLGMDTRAVLERFRSEEQALARMDHPNIAQVFEAGSSIEGRPYFAMEYVPGVPITEYCDSHRLDTRHRLALFLRVADAVQHAHQKGVIHRDLKPSNILVAECDGGPTPKIIDFGLAKATDKSLTDATVFTEAGVLLGTPEYMSPEQASVNGRDLDTRTDIYSLGVLLYELLVGAVPFDARTLRRAGYDEIRRVIREVDPPMPATRLLGLGALAAEVAMRRSTDADRLRRELRGDLEWITMRALEKERARRYPSASEMAADIQHHLRDEPVTAGPISTAYRVRKFVRRNRATVAFAIMIAVALIGGIVVSSAYYRQAAQQGRYAGREAYRANIAAAASDLDNQDLGQAAIRLYGCERALRGWEWRYLVSQLDPDIESRWGTGPATHNAAFTFRDGNLFWSSGENLIVWPAGSQKGSGVYGGFGEILALSRDARRVAVRPYRNRKILRILDPVSGNRLAEIQTMRPLMCAAFSGDGDRVALGLDDGGIAVVSAVSGQMMREARAAPSLVTVVTFSPDGKRIFSGFIDGTSQLWDANSLRPLATPFRDKSQVVAAVYSPDGSKLATAAGRDLQMRNASDGSQRYITNILPEITALAFSPDGKHLALTAKDRSVQVVDPTLGKPEADFVTGTIGPPVAVAFDPTGSLLYISSEFGEVLGYDKPVWNGGVWKEATAEIVSLDFNADGSRVLAGTKDSLEIWDGRTGATIARRPAPGKGTSPVAFSRDGTKATWGSGSTDVNIWDGTATRTFTGHNGRVTTSTFRPDGRMIASGSLDQTVRIWDATTGALLRVLPLHEPVWRVRFSPDGSRLLVSCNERTFKLWDTATWRVVAVLATEPMLRGKMAGDAVFTPDGRRIVCGFGNDDKIALWDARSGRLLDAVSETRAQLVMGFNSDGTRLLTGSEEGIARVWDAQSLKLLLPLRMENHARSFRFSPDSDRLLFAQGSVVRQLDTRTTHRLEALYLFDRAEQTLGVDPPREKLDRYIREKKDLDPPLREAALEQLGMLGPFEKIEVSTAALLSPSADIGVYRKMLEIARRAAADDPSSGDTINALGAALYRVGRFQEAAATLEHCQELRKCDAGRNGAFLAMTLARLGRQREAEALVAKLHAMTPPSKPEEQALLREVDSVVASSRPY